MMVVVMVTVMVTVMMAVMAIVGVMIVMVMPVMVMAVGWRLQRGHCIQHRRRSAAGAHQGLCDTRGYFAQAPVILMDTSIKLIQAPVIPDAISN